MLAKSGVSVADLLQIQEKLAEAQQNSTAKPRSAKCSPTKPKKLPSKSHSAPSNAPPAAAPSPLSAKALRDSGSVLGDSLAALITAIAAIIPWLIVIVPGIWALVKVVKRWRKNRAAKKIRRRTGCLKAASGFLTSRNAESAVGGAMFCKPSARRLFYVLACARCIMAALSCVPIAVSQTSNAPPAHEVVFYPSGKLRIETYLYKPEGKGPFPVVIYNHGSRPEREATEMPFAYVGKMLAASGYLVLAPERRGYGKSEGTLFSEEIGNDRGPRYVARLQQEADDVIAAAGICKDVARRRRFANRGDGMVF